MTQPRLIVIALDPATAGSQKASQHVVAWVRDNLCNPERDHFDLVCALSLDSEFDENELDLTSGCDRSYLLEMEEKIVSEAQNAMERYAQFLRQAGARTDVHVLKSWTDTRDLIANYVEKSRADLLVMGSRDLSVWKRYFLGSFSDYVQHHCHCPVVIVKDTEKRRPSLEE
ncbi:uncharacterized protein VTP21DRAFT_6255 [Calcarisporiella thermophila]|uniref:uncharacterized protein n=1 Tax=Calcarisporiella thermophila TaxID=911321 RepID=UPI003741F3EB